MERLFLFLDEFFRADQNYFVCTDQILGMESCASSCSGLALSNSVPSACAAASSPVTAVRFRALVQPQATDPVRGPVLADWLGVWRRAPLGNAPALSESVYESLWVRVPPHTETNTLGLAC